VFQVKGSFFATQKMCFQVHKEIVPTLEDCQLL